MSLLIPIVAVIDDEEPVRKAIGRLLRSAGMTVELFPGGADFLASLLTRRPDCAVLDLHMPDVTGFDVLQQLATAGDCLPVVIISGHSPPAADLARRGEAVIFLHKPVAEMALLGAISAAIANSAKTHFPQ
ncbi:response regulator [bacterium]|nr:response regulator [bacterium]